MDAETTHVEFLTAGGSGAGYFGLGGGLGGRVGLTAEGAGFDGCHGCLLFVGCVWRSFTLW